MRNNADTTEDFEVLVLAISKMQTADFAPRSIEREIRRLPGVKRILMSSFVVAAAVEYLPTEVDASFAAFSALSAGCHPEPWFGNPLTEMVYVEYDPSEVDVRQLIGALQHASFDAGPSLAVGLHGPQSTRGNVDGLSRWHLGRPEDTS